MITSAIQLKAKIRNGKTDITITRGDMTDSELEYLQSELERRINNS